MVRPACILYPSITMSVCMAHCLDNFLKDIGQLSCFDLVAKKASYTVTSVLLSAAATQIWQEIKQSAIKDNMLTFS